MEQSEGFEAKSKHEEKEFVWVEAKSKAVV
jgi:hypothetical protein